MIDTTQIVAITANYVYYGDKRVRTTRTLLNAIVKQACKITEQCVFTCDILDYCDKCIEDEPCIEVADMQAVCGMRLYSNKLRETIETYYQHACWCRDKSNHLLTNMTEVF